MAAVMGRAAGKAELKAENSGSTHTSKKPTCFERSRPRAGC